jgi:PhnB protein
MLTDTTPDRPVPAESNLSIALDFADPASMATAFEALAAGGTVVCPIQDSFWGAKFGIAKDACGVSWMFNCQVQQAAHP